MVFLNHSIITCFRNQPFSVAFVFQFLFPSFRTSFVVAFFVERTKTVKISYKGKAKRIVCQHTHKIKPKHVPLKMGISLLINKLSQAEIDDCVCYFSALCFRYT